MVVCLTAVFVVPFFADKITPFLDANSAWRIRFWNDELVQLVQSKGIGVGFGTAYATETSHPYRAMLSTRSIASIQ